MSEIKRPELPIPLANYFRLLKQRKSPYYDIIQHLLKEMEIHYEISKGNQNYSEVIYSINPRVLQEELEKKIEENREKLTTLNICRTILAFLYGSRLREGKDFYVTTTSGGRRNYHVILNTKNLNLMSRFV